MGSWSWDHLLGVFLDLDHGGETARPGWWQQWTEVWTKVVALALPLASHATTGPGLLPSLNLCFNQRAYLYSSNSISRIKHLLTPLPRFYPKACFLILITIDILDWIVFAVERCPAYCKVLNCIPGLCPLPASSNPLQQLVTIKVSRHHQMSLGGQHQSWLGTTVAGHQNKDGCMSNEIWSSTV